jgi:hypothetical protein
MKKILIMTVIIIIAAISNTMATPLIWRGASTIKPMQFIGQVNLFYSQTTKSYDWTNNEWTSLADDKKTTSINAQIMAGLSPFKNFEFLVLAPIASKTQDTLNSFGPGDFWIKARYGLVSSKLVPIKFTLSGALVLPFASKDANPSLDDRTTDIGIGGILQTKSFGPFVGHLRFGYWFNGKTNDTTKVGDMLEYVAKLDYQLNKIITPFLSIWGTMQGKTEYNGEAKENTQKDRHNVQIGLVAKPISMLSIRPKISVPLEFICKGGSNAPFQIGLDFWVIAP